VWWAFFSFFFAEAWQPAFLLWFHFYLKSHLCYYSLYLPCLLSLRGALQRWCFPQQVSWLNVKTNYSYLKAVTVAFNFTVSCCSVLSKCQNPPSLFYRDHSMCLTCKRVIPMCPLLHGRENRCCYPPKGASGTCCGRWSPGCQKQSLWAGWSFTRTCVYRAWN